RIVGRPDHAAKAHGPDASLVTVAIERPQTPPAALGSHRLGPGAVGLEHSHDLVADDHDPFVKSQARVEVGGGAEVEGLPGLAVIGAGRDQPRVADDAHAVGPGPGVVQISLADDHRIDDQVAQATILVAPDHHDAR